MCLAFPIKVRKYGIINNYVNKFLVFDFTENISCTSFPAKIWSIYSKFSCCNINIFQKSYIKMSQKKL